jgi:endoglucanase
MAWAEGAVRSRSLVLGFTLLLGVLPGAPGPSVSPAEQEATSGRPALPPASSSNQPEARTTRLKRGINASHWFAQVRDATGYTAEHLATHVTAQDLALIRSLRFDHVRVSVDPTPMWAPGQLRMISAEHVAQLTRAVAMVLAHDLALVVDIHPSTEFKRKLETDDRHVEVFVEFWRALAAHLAAMDPGRVFLEVLNEPEFTDAYRWAGVQAKLVAAIRQSAPDHTIIVTGHRWSGIDDLLALEPLADRNLLYSFHFYAPHLFTHQGATWGLTHWRQLENVPYPSSPEGLQPMTATIADDLTRLRLIRYGHDRWSAERIEAEIGQVAAWARRHQVRVTCNEFGVHRRAANPSDRTTWIGDVRIALERHGIGWTMWDYAGDFGIVTKAGDQTAVDHAIVKALGLERLTPE